MKKFKLGEFERNSAIVFAVSMLANVVTYLYQIVMGILASQADYGTINTLLSLSIVVGVPSGIISTLVATYTAKYQAVGKPELIGGFMHKMLRASVLLACVVFAAGAALSSIIANVLQIEETRYGHHGRGGVQLWRRCCVTLQGVKRFVPYSINGVLNIAMRTAAQHPFCADGFRGIGGDLAAVIVAALATAAFCFWCARDLFFAPKIEQLHLDRTGITACCFVSTFWFQLFLLLMANGDVLLIKTFAADPAEVGIYSSGSVIGKISLYLANAIVPVLLPMVAGANPPATIPASCSSAPCFGAAVLRCCALWA